MLSLSKKSFLGRTAKLKYLHSLPRTISVVFFSNSTEDSKQTDTAQGRKEYDIAIVGGGMVGAAVGCGLASLPLTKALKIAIIDSNPTLGVKKIFPKDDIPDPRVSTITPATVSFFKDIGAWEHVQECRHAPFDKMQVWDYTGWGYTRYNARDVGKQVLGYVVENKVLHNALLLCLQDKGYAEMIYPAKVKSVLSPSNSQSMLKSNSTGQADNNNTLSASSEDPLNSNFPHSLAKVKLDDGSCLYARLVVGADGGRSQVRSMTGFQTSGWDYKQHALICTVELETENQTAWQRFLPTGPLALLPMGKKFSNIVWSTTPEQAAQLKGMTQNEFVHEVNRALQHDCGPHLLSQISGVLDSTPSISEIFQVPPRVTGLSTERMSFPLSLMHARSYASNRVVLVGDAAHTVHPLAGQGVNLGFGDAAELVRILNEGILTGSDIGEISLLKKYERERKLVNLPMMAILDGFQRIFSADFGPVNMLRAAAFSGVQFLGPLKRQVMSYAMGDQKWPLFPLNLDKVLRS
ncbi:hypothetical protein SUGI_0081450 [Cryptomeria japonica]|uniref:uncharacterized protein LOC131060082 n=1 Tax=Cryptomeria japonica TaxID=3369 RepID=UPI0024089F0E|nr:uncharacterized protein LOC131060082 [Cryptomeria japonica]GLJ08108.1 hypothetical protein SUGI_0081450 [Cryptomeria japonica]